METFLLLLLMSQILYSDSFVLPRLDAKLMGLQLFKSTHLPPFSIDQLSNLFLLSVVFKIL